MVHFVLDSTSVNKKVIFFANTAWYLYNFRLSLALRLRNDGWEVVLISPPGEYVAVLQSLGFRWHPIALSTLSTNPLGEFGSLLWLIKFYRQEKPDLVHHFTIKCILYGSLAARLAGNRKVVNAVTGLGHIFTDLGIKARILRPIVKLFYRLVFSNHLGRVIFQNVEDLDTFVAFGLVDRSLTRLIRGSGVDCQLFAPTPPRVVPGSGHPVRILYASRLLKEKGIFELIAAARQILSGGVDCEFLLAGDLYPGNPSSLTEQDLQNIRTDGTVTCLGHIDDMPALIAKSDIVVLPSYREGTPRILIEAAAMGKPIVSTDIAGCRGVVQNGVNGFLVPVKTIEPLTKALKQLIVSPQLRQTMGDAGRQIVLDEFDEQIVLRKTFEVYAEIMN